MGGFDLGHGRDAAQGPVVADDVEHLDDLPLGQDAAQGGEELVGDVRAGRDRDGELEYRPVWSGQGGFVWS
jgi:hypothetical protein